MQRLARELALEILTLSILAPNGETFHNVTVTGGKQRNEGPLSMKRELRDVLKLIGEVERDIQSETASPFGTRRYSRPHWAAHPT